MAIRVPVLVDAAAIDTTGVKATYTAPASGGGAKVTNYSVFSAGTLFIWQVEIVRSAATITVFSSTAAQSKNVDSADILLQPGDVFNIRISTVGAGGNTGDFAIGVQQYDPGESP